MSVHTPRFNRLNGYANHYILWMYLHLPAVFNRHITTRLYRLSEFITMKDITDQYLDADLSMSQIGELEQIGMDADNAREF